MLATSYSGIASKFCLVLVQISLKYCSRLEILHEGYILKLLKLIFCTCICVFVCVVCVCVLGGRGFKDQRECGKKCEKEKLKSVRGVCRRQ